MRRRWRSELLWIRRTRATAQKPPHASRKVLSSCSERLGYFDPDPSHAFLAVEMEIERRTDRRRSSATRQRFNITISVNPLVPLIDEHPSPTIPWDEWGPDRSRLSRAPIGSRFPLGHLPKFHACGTRYSSGPQTRGQDSADIVRVWDTHPRRVMKSLAFQPTGTAIQQGSVFQDSYLAEGSFKACRIANYIRYCRRTLCLYLSIKTRPACA
ncbi:hypothetical protein BC834DRAFT_519675 [Gloeopeniophorella convolvens]|nr:hypothetical protein BC834DRAFT_519675 [Gloeopeniophorella convolvens]